MLRLPKFRLHQPATLAEAASILDAEGEAARLVAGGTDLWPNLKRRHQKAGEVVSLSRLAELRAVNANGDLHLGAMATLTSVERHAAVRERFPALAAAVGWISSPVLRNMGTIGGNVCLDTRCTYYNQNEEWRQSISYCMKAEGKICWVAPSSPRCWAVQSADSAPMLVALGARVTLVSTAGERQIPIAALYHDDGMAYLTKRRDEIVTAIVVPGASDAAHCRTAFFKLRRRGSIDFGVLSVAVALWMDGGSDGTVRDARVVLGSIASLPSSADEVAQALIGQKLTPETIAAAASKARSAATPMDNTDLDPRWRGQVTPVYVERTLREAAGLPAG
ncbi:MAG: FAD binding domain-containing protein [Thermoanaerobaculia bacterium]|nr:FAD binding domain-containing protein [Thermoanaerobaculia bacterium]MBP9823842.1 FAD binding domain-containing protein [Thermoanaerobaculia bacterium]